MYKTLPEQNTDVQYIHSNIINVCKTQVLAEIILEDVVGVRDPSGAVIVTKG